MTGCSPKPSEVKAGNTLFTHMPADFTGIDFTNRLTYNEEFNVYTYRNFYNGGGVGLGDVNNDGLLDIYFCGNMMPSRLYLNKGNFQFEDITDKAGVACEGSWATGVSFADINGDGLQDLYVCKSGKPEGERRYNELFINNGDLTFTEQSEKYGLNDKGFSTHAAFFDYDKDGDLDCYLLNNSFRPIGGFDLKRNQRTERDSLGGNKLYRNDNGHFVDASDEAGIYGSIIGFGLGVTVGDVNRDGWQDIYVSNDFFERDYLYINNKNGTFTESLEKQIRELSAASMGADMADVNNDGYPEIFVTDMLPRDDARIKTKTTFEDWNKYRANLMNGYYHQFTRNVFQLNNGPSDTSGQVTFSEIGRMSGVYATDWSWGALIMDMDNDGLKDIFVANAIYQDLTDQDFLLYASDPRFIQSVVTREKFDFKKLIEIIPSNSLPNYAFHNNGDLTFTNEADSWGLGEPSFSNGSAYGDLDNDGDLDLVTNNCNTPSFVYRNETNAMRPDHHYLKFILKGEGANTQAVGTAITVYHGGQQYYLEQMPVRGFQSTVDFRPNFGLGNIDKVDSVVVLWPDFKKTVLTQVPVNQTITLAQSEALPAGEKLIKPRVTRTLLVQDTTSGIRFTHTENEYNDFNRDRLLYQMLSSEGPKIAVGDINGDKRDDFYVGNAKDSPGALYVQQANGSFRREQDEVFAMDKASEDTDCLFFDADHDGDLDLYVACGGSEFPSTSTELLNRLYINQSGRFVRSKQLLPSATQPENTSTVEAADYDRDGDMDLFVGVRLRPFLYGTPVSGYLLQNDGKGNFTDVTAKAAPGLVNIGMITGSLWMDYDTDGDPDLIVTGEYMPVKVFQNQKGSFTDVTEAAGLTRSNGFWNTLSAADVDGDGDLDIIAGNHGLNSRFKGSQEHPVCMYINDFDQNGSAEQLICVYNGDKSYPLALRHDLVAQVPQLKKKYLKYESYKNQTIEDIFTPEQRANMITLNAYEMRSSVLINNGGRFDIRPLPIEAQLAPVYGMICEDMDGDKIPDILLAGNFLRAKPEVGGQLSSYGLFLKGDGKGGFASVPARESGFSVIGEVRDLALIRRGRTRSVLVARNNGPMEVFSF
ncbi:MAG: hypothetical protein EAZ89_12045 [Bacteroidetes bacterium]|nr:MAG: hypothetical protein EAZ89_12045 [Bacteroidota bacterium]